MLNRKIFSNRKDAGQKLAEKLRQYKNAIVFGIPRGGIEIAYYVAKQLESELSVLISKKIPHPQNEDYAIGAIAEEGVIYVPDYVNFSMHIFDPFIEDLGKEIESRINLYRNGKPLPNITNCTVLLIDDGIATGATLIPAIRLCRQKGARKIIVTAPVSSQELDPALNEADEIVILEKQEPFFGVAQAYQDFNQLTDNEVINFLNAQEIHNNY